MLKNLLIIGFLLTNNCELKKMKEVTIKLDTLIEEKTLFEHTEFKEKFEKPSEENTLILKDTKKLFTGLLNVLFPSGEKFAKYQYVNGHQQGKQIVFFKNGNTHVQLSINKGKYNDKYIIYYENGKMKSVGFYKNGIQTSLESYHFNGNKSSEYTNYENSHKQEEKTYYNSGALLSHRLYSKDKIKVIYFYENNSKESEGIEIKKGKSFLSLTKEGLWKYYHKNGNIKEQGNWAMGGRHGEQNIKIGVWKIYNKDGELIKKQEYNKLGAKVK